MKKETRYLTEEKYKELKKELEYLEKEGRKKVAENISKAASYGDLSENAAWDDAKDEQGLLEAKINSIKSILKESKIIKGGKTDFVGIGSKVTISSKDDSFTFSLVGAGGANVVEGKISYESPIGRALLGKRKGDKVEIKTPRGRANYKVDKIE